MTTMLTTREAAAFLGTTVNAMKKWRHFGTGPDYIREGRSVKYSPQVLAEYLAQQGAEDEETPWGTNRDLLHALRFETATAEALARWALDCPLTGDHGAECVKEGPTDPRLLALEQAQPGDWAVCGGSLAQKVCYSGHTWRISETGERLTTYGVWSRGFSIETLAKEAA